MDELNRCLDEARQARRAGRLDDATRGFERAAALAQQPGQAPQLVEALKGLGQLERDRGRLEASLVLYVAALALSRHAGDALAVAHTARHVADVQRGLGRLVEAQAPAREAVELCRLHANVPALERANAVRVLALIEEAAGRRDEARPLWQEALAFYDLAGVPAGAAECRHQLDADRPTD
jgi:tetratricopeptide (TPR) repeat protein